MKLCLDCNSPAAGTRCRACQRNFDRARAPQRAPYMKRAYRDLPLDGMRCACCESIEDLTRHHVSPLALGDWTGVLVAMCRRCNSSIGSRRMKTLTCPLHGGEFQP